MESTCEEGEEHGKEKRAVSSVVRAGDSYRLVGSSKLSRPIMRMCIIRLEESLVFLSLSGWKKKIERSAYRASCPRGVPAWRI